ncbi:MAG: glycosyltransferase [Bacteroidales bacterium]|jgi:glycosyltransferase involved in cell wall biosynthesis|nr:glycosyltransferase [Bacteroidales bacterium]MDD4395035.1 glycosyltransferase [Bacteroidales bacterium]
MLFIIPVNLPNLFLILLCVIVVLLLIYYLLILGRYAFRKTSKTEGVSQSAFPPISVVVTSRDESHLIIHSLPSLLTQDYPNYEVVVVNDNSRDETEQLIREFSFKYPHLHYVHLSDSVSNISGKKFPLSIGIKSAKNECIVLTTVSSKPVSPFWLQHMAQRFVKKTNVVVAFSGYEKSKGAGNSLLHYDNFVSYLNAFAYTLAKMPVLANGSNLAYTKSFFFNNSATFFAHANLPFGEDDVFINKVSNQVSCEVQDHPDSFILRRKPNLARWLSQKKWACISRQYYKSFPRFLLKFYNFLSLLFYVVLGFAAFYVIRDFVALHSVHHIFMLSTLGGLFLIKETLQYVVLGKAAVKLQEKQLIPGILLYDILFSLLNPLIYLSSKFVRRKWR